MKIDPNALLALHSEFVTRIASLEQENEALRAALAAQTEGAEPDAEDDGVTV